MVATKYLNFILVVDYAGLIFCDEKYIFCCEYHLLYSTSYLFRSGEDEGFSLGWEIEEKEVAGVGRVGTVGEAG